MPKGYWIVHIEVRDPEIYQQYVKANGAAFAKYGARFLVRGGKHVVTRGKAAERNVVIEFRDYETAVANQASADGALRAARHAVAIFGKSEAEMREALAVGILCFNVESEAELSRLNRVAKEMNRTAPISPSSKC